MSRRKPKRRRRGKESSSWVTYPRCCLLTIGSIFLGIVAAVFWTQGHERSEWPSWSYLLLGGLALAGLIMLAIAMFGSRNDAEVWADDASHPAASILVMLIAAPVYFLLKAVEGIVSGGK